jgi:hypothetical protein
MSFTPRTLGNGRICCSNPTALCDKCKAHATRHAKKETTMSRKSDRILQAVDDVMGTNFRAAAGARHSAADQQHLDAAALHLGAAGASPDTATADDLAQARADAQHYRDRGEHYKADRTLELAASRANGRRMAAERAAAPPPQMRASEEYAAPDPYAMPDRQPTQHDLTPDMDPDYNPATGHPADGYKLATALRKLNAENAAPTVRAASARSPKTIFTNNVPDGYATAIARRNAS